MKVKDISQVLSCNCDICLVNYDQYRKSSKFEVSVYDADYCDKEVNRITVYKDAIVLII